MAASVRVEDEAFADRRYHRLAKLAGLADDDHARGKMLVLWRQCTIENQEVLPLVDVLDVLGSEGVAALEGAGLGEDMGDGTVRIRGTAGRIEWLQKLRENGKKGGRPKGSKNQKVSPENQEVPENEPIGSAELNPPAPAPAPVPAKDSTLSGASGSDTPPPSKPKKVKPPPSATATKAAEYLRGRILEKAPNCSAARLTPKQVEDWGRALDKLEGLSPEHTWAGIRETIDWLHDSENTFVVQSPVKLAERWDSIQANRRKPTFGRPGAQTVTDFSDERIL